MRAASARRTSGSRLRSIADKDNKLCGAGALAREKVSSKRTLEGITNSHSLGGRHDSLSQLNDLVQHTMGNFPFRGLRNLNHFTGRDNRDRVAVGIETDALAENVVYDNRIE